MKPVIIGSYALKQYGYNEGPHDIDVIVNNETANVLRLACNKIEGNMLYFNDLFNFPVRKMDIIVALPDSSDWLILQYVNSIISQTIVISNIEFLIAPLDLLYIIKKSHISRILPITNNLSTNIVIWKKQMIMYKWICDHIDYVKIKNTLNNTNNSPLKDIYFARFQETIERVGDTNISMNKKQSEFFKDNVRRYIEHDELHKMVAQMCRQTDDVLFEKMLDPTSDTVGMSEELFNLASYIVQIQILVEEIIVLFLERKILPVLNEEYKQNNVKFTGFNNNILDEYFEEIVAHFITNLCGQNHYWLRQYCLNHYHVLNDKNRYNYENIVQLGCKITNIKYSTDGDNEVISLEDVLANMEKYKDNNKKFIDILIKRIPKNMLNENDVDMYFQSVQSDNFDVIKKCYQIASNKDSCYRWNKGKKFAMIKTIFHIPTFIMKEDHNNTIINLIHKMEGTVILDYQEKEEWFMLYDLENNIGIEWSKHGFQIFAIEIRKSNDNLPSLYVRGTYFRLNNLECDTFNIGSIKKSIICTYFSLENCNYQDHSPDREFYSYLSSYGNCPYFLNNLVELLARCFLKVNNDDEHTETSSDGTFCKHEEADDGDELLYGIQDIESKKW